MLRWYCNPLVYKPVSSSSLLKCLDTIMIVTSCIAMILACCAIERGVWGRFLAGKALWSARVPSDLSLFRLAMQWIRVFGGDSPLVRRHGLLEFPPICPCRRTSCQRITQETYMQGSSVDNFCTAESQTARAT